MKSDVLKGGGRTGEVNNRFVKKKKVENKRKVKTNLSVRSL